MWKENRIRTGYLYYWKNIIDDEEVEVTSESNLMDDLSLSSLEMLASLMHLEKEYGIIIPEKYLRRMFTIGDVASVLTEIMEKSKR